MDRQPIEDIYKLIISDLEYAGNNLEAFYTGEEAGRVGSVAAKCLLGTPKNRELHPLDGDQDIITAQ